MEIFSFIRTFAAMKTRARKMKWDKAGEQLHKILTERLKDPKFANTAFVKRGLWMTRQSLIFSIEEKNKYILKKYC